MRVDYDDEYLSIVSCDGKDGFEIARMLESVKGLKIEDYCVGGFDCDPGEGWLKTYASADEMASDKEWLEGESWDSYFVGASFNGVPVGIHAFPNGKSIEIFWSNKRKLPDLVSAILSAGEKK